MRHVETYRIAICWFLLCLLFPGAVFAQEAPTYDDPFYGQKGTLQLIEERRLAPFQQVKESVDPFTGNLNLHHVDAILPGQSIHLTNRAMSELKHPMMSACHA